MLRAEALWTDHIGGSRKKRHIQTIFLPVDKRVQITILKSYNCISNWHALRIAVTLNKKKTYYKNQTQGLFGTEIKFRCGVSVI